MAGAKSQMSLVGLDFNTIKDNLKTYLKSQDTFKDYNFEGSGLSTILDVLAYNTQYNAFYLNMVANEMFLDTALQRSSVVSHAKLMDYVPKSSIAPTAFVDVKVTGVSNTSLTIPTHTNFLSESIGGVNYNFVTINPITENTNLANNTVDLKDQAGALLANSTPLSRNRNVYQPLDASCRSRNRPTCSVGTDCWRRYRFCDSRCL